jgi:hypothetical protein
MKGNLFIWRRREGVEPSGNLTAPRLVLKTSGTTGHLPSPSQIHLVSMSYSPGKAGDGDALYFPIKPNFSLVSFDLSDIVIDTH